MICVEGEVIEVKKSETKIISSIRRKHAVLLLCIILYFYQQQCYLTDYIIPRYLQYSGTRVTTWRLYRSNHIRFLLIEISRLARYLGRH